MTFGEEMALLFHSDAFCQIAWAIYVLAFADGDVIGEELEGNRGNEGLEVFEGVG